MAEKELSKAQVRHTGQEYRAKKARGDVKREGQPDPFAYIPLNPKIVASGKGKRKNIKVNKKLFDL
jgi:ribosomal RNA-processing protein 12